MTQPAAGLLRKAAAHTALPISVIAVALLAFAGIGFAAGWGSAPTAQPSQSTQGQASASIQWLQTHPGQVQWMQNHPAQWQWMQDHMADITWMRDHHGQVQWAQDHPAQWQWMQDHMGDIKWMQDHWDSWTAWHSGSPSAAAGDGWMMNPSQGHQP